MRRIWPSFSNSEKLRITRCSPKADTFLRSTESTQRNSFAALTSLSTTAWLPASLPEGDSISTSDLINVSMLCCRDLKAVSNWLARSGEMSLEGIFRLQAKALDVLIVSFRTVSDSMRARFTSNPIPGKSGGLIVPELLTTTAGSMMSSDQYRELEDTSPGNE